MKRIRVKVPDTIKSKDAAIAAALRGTEEIQFEKGYEDEDCMVRVDSPIDTHIRYIRYGDIPKDWLKEVHVCAECEGVW